MKRLIHIFIIALLCFAASDGAPAKKRTSSGIKKEKASLNTEINNTKKQIEANRSHTQAQLNALDALKGEISESNRRIADISAQISGTEQAQRRVSDSISALEAKNKKLKDLCALTLRADRKNRQSLSELELIFASKSFYEAIKRSSHIHQANKKAVELAGKLSENIAQLDISHKRLAALKEKQKAQLAALSQENKALVAKQGKTQALVTDLKRQAGTLNQLLAEKQQKARELDNEITRLIAQEQREEAERRAREEAARKAEQERLRAEAERKARAEREALEQKRRAEALAAQKAEQERVQAEKAIKNASSKKEAERLKKLEQQRQREEAKQKREQEKKQQELARKQQEQANKELAQAKKNKKGKKQDAVKQPDMAAVAPAPVPKSAASTPKMSGSFASNKGRMLFPVDGRYTIIGTFGANRHENLPNIVVDNSGIDILASTGARARAVFDGQVSMIVNLGGAYHNVVMVRHGQYITVYSNLDKLSVSKGDNVRAGQTIGTVATDKAEGRTVMHFEVRKETTKLNPLEWVKR